MIGNRKQKIQPLDRAAIALILILSVLLALLIWGSNACSGSDCWLHSGPRVRNFSWQDQRISADDRAFILTFSRPMNKANVQSNLKIEPELLGKFSWVGRTMAYTLDKPAPYGTEYSLRLQGAREQFSDAESQGELMQPFATQFFSRDRAFAYIGIEDDERGRLVLFNLTQDSKTILTPKNLVVTEFESYPNRAYIAFAAVDTRDEQANLVEQQIYRVATGLNSDAAADLEAGNIDLLVDNSNYRNLSYDLAQDGETLVVQRINREDPADFSLWVKRGDEPIEQLNELPSGDFLIAPDSNSVVSSQGEGVAVLSLTPQAEPLDFLPKFGKVLDFTRDGTAAVMVDFNQNDPDKRYTQSLYFVNSQGTQQELINVPGSILDCKFNPSSTKLYCLLTELIKGEQYIEQPYLALIDLEAGESAPIVKLPDHNDVNMSLAPDGLGLLFDQVMLEEDPTSDSLLRTGSGNAIASSRIWLLLTTSVTPNEETPPQLEELPMRGLRPQWLP
ncbi:MAG: hypothetical protein SAJ12_12210 [Jaaginema sp. PMC 1079.18]|nr:hypothetical protein [Jaaginema sp. PMC 1080.18]MEC4851769.1 hypothetical protein [Jaaginema sp. PMC 1079.18]MEC4864521.1 hypothetical protein [Jaaginema sp. PMC 1078.18]